METGIAIFRGKEIRKTVHNNEWWFSIVDVVEALTGSERPRKYWNDLKKKLLEEGYEQLSEKIGQLKMKSAGGKLYETDCSNNETMFRIIQSIPSPKAEPFKRWLAKVGYERVQEIEDPQEGRLPRELSDNAGENQKDRKEVMPLDRAYFAAPETHSHQGSAIYDLCLLW